MPRRAIHHPMLTMAATTASVTANIMEYELFEGLREICHEQYGPSSPASRSGLFKPSFGLPTDSGQQDSYIAIQYRSRLLLSRVWKLLLRAGGVLDVQRARLPAPRERSPRCRCRLHTDNRPRSMSSLSTLHGHPVCHACLLRFVDAVSGL